MVKLTTTANAKVILHPVPLGGYEKIESISSEGVSRLALKCVGTNSGDKDGACNIHEKKINAGMPNKTDFDGDGVNDDEEIYLRLSNPLDGNSTSFYQGGSDSDEDNQDEGGTGNTTQGLTTLTNGTGGSGNPLLPEPHRTNDPENEEDTPREEFYKLLLEVNGTKCGEGCCAGECAGKGYENCSKQGETPSLSSGGGSGQNQEKRGQEPVCCDKPKHGYYDGNEFKCCYGDVADSGSTDSFSCPSEVENEEGQNNTDYTIEVKIGQCCGFRGKGHEIIQTESESNDDSDDQCEGLQLTIPNGASPVRCCDHKESVMSVLKHFQNFRRLIGRSVIDRDHFKRNLLRHPIDRFDQPGCLFAAVKDRYDKTNVHLIVLH